MQQHLIEKTTNLTIKLDSQFNNEEEQEKNKIIEYIRLRVAEGGTKE